MSDEGSLPAIPWEQVVAGASALAAGTRVSEMAARFLALVESWASPSAVLCACRDPEAAEGVRMVPELTSGAVTAAAERSLAKLFTDYPADTITRPTLLAPAEEAAGVRVRDTLVVPWSHGAGVSGFLVLRGLPRPLPANLGDAVSLLAHALWPRLGLQVAPPANEVEATRRGVEVRLREIGRVVEHLEADWRSARSAAEAETDRLNGELQALRGKVESLQKAAATAEQEKATADAAGAARAKAETERDAARSEAAELRSRVEALQREQETARAQAESAAAASEETGKARAQAETERDAAKTEAAELRGRVESVQRELEAARSQAEAARASIDEAGKARAQAETERDAARSEASELRGRVESGQRELEALRTQAQSATAGTEAVGKALAQAQAERDAARAESAELKSTIETLQRELGAHSFQSAAAEAGTEAADKALDQTRAERDAARSEATELRGRIETLQREADGLRAQVKAAMVGTEADTHARAQAEAERDAARTENAELRGRIATAQREREEARLALATAAGRGEKAEAQGQRAVEVFMNGFEAIRRTPFVPPTVRVWVDEARALLGPKAASRPRLGRILLLDRDAPMLSVLAGDLEEAGLDVLIAHHPDEVSLFLKTPDAAGLTALVLDVLSLRPDQNIAELVRSWRHDLPGLVLFLTFRAENPNEAERAQRLPVTATAGYLPRPLQKGAVLEAVASLARRTAKR